MKEIFNKNRAWLMSLSSKSKNPNGSYWGSPGALLGEIEDSKIENGDYILSSEVYGQVKGKAELAAGDLIGFYHSHRAKFLHGGNKPRLSAFGQIMSVNQKDGNVSYLKVRIPEDLLHALAHTPMLRNDRNNPVFEDCGIVQGAVFTYFPVPGSALQKVKEHLFHAVEDYTGENPY